MSRPKHIHIKHNVLVGGWIIYRTINTENGESIFTSAYGNTVYFATTPETPYWDWGLKKATVYATKAEAVFVAQNNPYLKDWTLA
jgi:hypothetical protein